MGRGKKRVVVEEVGEENDDDTSGGGSGYDDLTASKCLALWFIMQYNPPFTDSTLILVSMKDLGWLEWLY